jgi:hypothetical protein
MRSLLAMAEANEDMLLCGPSDCGMTDPAHAAAIALIQTTAAFLMCYAEDEDCSIDRSASIVMICLLGRLEKEVGERFMEIERTIKQD